MYIERNEYLEKLKAKRWNGQIKVITGLRRSGKSFLLFNIFRDNIRTAFNRFFINVFIVCCFSTITF